MIGFDLSTISDCYIGSTQASEIYYGATKIWPAVDYSREYLTIEPLANGTLSFTKSASSGDLYYSDDKQNWITYSSSIILTNGHNIYLKGDMIPKSIPGDPFKGIGTLSATSNINISGNIMSLLYGDNFIGQTSLSGKSWVFYSLFISNPIINAKNLVLPATTLASECYMYMLSYCPSLTSAPALPATTLSFECYSYMFEHCPSLTTAPELPATTLAQYCYSQMFNSCTSLTTAPELPATTLANNCYSSMFSGCHSLTTAPELPATILAIQCYSSMFSGCRSLTTAPELPATTLANNCYSNMFEGCRSLTTAPVLPATTLTSNCYNNMFASCWLLTTAPSLPATTLEQYCYSQMFRNCTSLNEVHCDATDISATDCLTDWLNNVSPTGDFYKPSTTTYPSGASGIPSGWTIHSNAHDYSQDYLTLETLESGTFTWTDTNNGRSIVYSTDDGSTWTTLTAGSTTPTIAANSKVLLRAILGAGNINGNGTISSSGRFNVMGNIMSLVDGVNFNNLTTISNLYQFTSLFKNCMNLIDASNLILPATTLSSSCYNSMFMNCTSLTTSPSILPATTVSISGYANMFRGCTSLTTAPQLPATTLSSGCYSYMFSGCSSLTTAPTLPATNAVLNCYQYMFQNCSSLTTAPALPATTIASTCYSYMFDGCSSLTTAPALPATTLANNCYQYMFRGCSSLITAPELPAVKLLTACYRNMFEHCSRLNYIKCLATNISATNCTTFWVSGVAATGTFVKASSMSSWKTGIKGIPSGWTVQNA